ncbi:MAG: hypothetical protein ACRD34_05140 [Bryobacteraceae bacterium]
MAEQEQSGTRPATENIRDLTESTRELFQAGERVTSNLEELERRAQRATDWRAQLAKGSWIPAAFVVVCGIVLWRVFR